MPHNKYVSLRTTVTLSDAAQKLVTEYAESCRVSTSRAISDLVECSASRKPRIKMVNGIATFDVELRDAPLTTEQVRQLEDEPW